MRQVHRSQGGLSLIELIVVLAILIVLAAALYMIINRSSTAYAEGSKLSTIEENGRRAVDRIANELREADGSTYIPNATFPTPATLIRFKVPASYTQNVDPTKAGVMNPSTEIEYRLDSSIVDANGNKVADDFALVRSQNGQILKLCDYVKSGGLTFTETRTGSIKNVKISLTLNVIDNKTKVLERIVQSSVTLRN